MSCVAKYKPKTSRVFNLKTNLIDIMTPKKYMKKKRGNKFLALILLLVSLLSCRTSIQKVKIPLESFAIKSEVLKECLSAIMADVKIDSSKHVICVSLDMVDTMKFYNITIDSKECFSENNIFWKNKRIVGYSYFRNKMILLVSNVDSHFDFLKSFSCDIDLTDETKVFDFVYYPSSKYKFGEDLGSWKDKTILYDPITFVCWQDSAMNIKFVLTNVPSIYMGQMDSLKRVSNDIELLYK